MAKPNSYEPNAWQRERAPGIAHSDIKQLNESRLDAGEMHKNEIIKPETISFEDGRRATVAYDRVSKTWTAIVDEDGQRFTMSSPTRRELVDTLMTARAEMEADYQASILPPENPELQDWLTNYECGRIYNSFRQYLSAYKVEQVWKRVLAQLKKLGWEDCEFNCQQVERAFVDAWNATDGDIIQKYISEIDALFLAQSNQAARTAEDARLRAQIAVITEPAPSANIPQRPDAFVGDEADRARMLSISELRRKAIPSLNPNRKHRG